MTARDRVVLALTVLLVFVVAAHELLLAML
jgi:hypothetical protein